MDNMSHVWKCNWNKFFILHKQSSESPFHNLTTINIHKCKSIKYLFSPLMAELLSNLKKVKIEWCDGIEEVVSNRDDEDEEMTTSTHTTTILFPHLDSLTLSGLYNLKCIGGGGAKDGSNEISFNNTTTTTAFLDQLELSEAGGVSWSLCQYSREITVVGCHALSSVIPCYAAAGQMQKLQVLRIWDCKGMKEVFETQRMKKKKKKKSGCDEGNGGIPRLNNVVMLPNLKILQIMGCGGLEHILTFSALESLRQLEELTIRYCYGMKVIVKKEEEDASSSCKEVVVFPCLKSIVLKDLPELVGFFSGENAFHWPSLDDVTIEDCPQMMVFAAGGSTAPQLKYIHTGLGKHTLDQESGLNFFHQIPSLMSHGATSYPATSERTIYSFHNLIELDVEWNNDVKKIIPSSELLQLQKLEKIRVSGCKMVEEVFEAAGRNRNSSSGSGFDESSQTTTTLVSLPNLREMELEYLNGLRYIWKSNQWTAFEFPNLTRVDVDECERLEHVFTSSMVGSLLQLQYLHISWCDRMEEVIVIEAEDSDGKTNEMLVLPCLRSLELHNLPCLKGFSLGTVFEFPNLTRVEINDCKRLEHVFTRSMVGSLLQLQELHIFRCSQMEEVIVKDANVAVEAEEESDGKGNEILVLPCLKSLILHNLPCLKGFSLGKEDFSFPLLDTLIIKYCPAITTFTNGNSATPQLKEIETNFGSFYAAGEKDINSVINIKQEDFKRDSY